MLGSRGAAQKFEENLEPRRILNSLEIASERITTGETLLFLDEIQVCPRALASLRYFYEEMPELHIVAAGTVLEFALGGISVPVGRPSCLRVGPMNFQEYLLALGKEAMAGVLLGKPEAVGAVAHEQILRDLRNYFFCGWHARGGEGVARQWVASRDDTRARGTSAIPPG